ncbi:MAG: hypothetical protein NVS3B25_28450 [Hymenobacter sp.]
MVVLHWVHAGHTQHVKHVVAQGHGPLHQLVDVAEHQRVGVLVVGAEHEVGVVLGQELDEGIEVAGCRAFADEDFHAHGQLVAGFGRREALVVGADAGAGVVGRVVLTQAGGVAVHGAAGGVGQGNFGHHVGVAVQHAGPVHHLGQVADFGVVEQAGNVGGCDFGPGRLERRGRHATWCPEAELEGRVPGVFQHKLHAGHTQHVADFVRVAHRGHGAVYHRQPGKLGRHQQGAFDVHVRIDEARQSVGQGRVGHHSPGGPDAGNAPPRHPNGSGLNGTGKDVDNIGGERKISGHKRGRKAAGKPTRCRFCASKEPYI